ncbi:hypothetical protein [Brevibacillus dissolubilis]|uniref:hypothetical protein n=1 Tax=Brevibacillus dissolubilis TaxID=1844116 RepID=UPI00111757AD|nr:hypothetical protein [Brevibacillus dissolubilis]
MGRQNISDDLALVAAWITLLADFMAAIGATVAVQPETETTTTTDNTDIQKRLDDWQNQMELQNKQIQKQQIQFQLWQLQMELKEIETKLEQRRNPKKKGSG